MFNLLNSKDNLKRKILDIKNEMRMIVSEVSAENVRVDWFGAYNIAPKYLAFWICVKTDYEKEKLITNKGLYLQLRYLLEKYNYPKEARKSVFIGFESQETVDRESDGNWYLHYK
ncbi:hypothetical protein ACFO4P_12065 [Epilithonimonas pallida]|uniref:Uncharacterized protein n=1 Tax=Epilithonimonas pallida TaxID=373671 RepID=A0ABY1R860_9FLAO|nr:hypothetical protein [Epilithonimonas pallida]SMP97254.1 hypothetical protein SAMN05421679_11210 [Epilithonimonas pallida]